MLGTNLSISCRRTLSSTIPFRSFNTTRQSVKRIKLPIDMEKDFQQSIFGKFEKINRNKELNDAIRSIYVFKDYIIPDSKNDPEFAHLIKKSYLYLVIAKSNNVLMPYFMKNGINAIVISTNPYTAAAYFFLYGGANLTAAYFDGLKTQENSKVVQTAWYKISMRAYKKLLELDL